MGKAVSIEDFSCLEEGGHFFVFFLPARDHLAGSASIYIDDVKVTENEKWC